MFHNIAILLKAEARTFQNVANELGGCAVVVNNWMKRYEEQAINGLVMRAGRGRRSILQSESDLEVVRLCVQKHRQEVSLVKAEWEETLGKELGILTLNRFLKKRLPSRIPARYKRLRRITNKKPNPDVYAFKKEYLAELERLSEQGKIDRIYGDESGVCLTP